MTAYTDFVENIREWAARPDWSDALVLSFIRTAEAQIARRLRVKEMMEIADGLVDSNRVKLPVDWKELDYVRVNNGLPLHYQARDDFFSDKGDRSRKYTIVGNYIMFGATIDAINGFPVEISYYKDVPPFVDDPTWLSLHYYDIYLQKCLSVGYLYGVEVEKSVAISNVVDGFIDAANDEHINSRNSGSVLRRRGTRRIG
jgi:hypothetical protein